MNRIITQRRIGRFLAMLMLLAFLIPSAHAQSPGDAPMPESSRLISFIGMRFDAKSDILTPLLMWADVSGSEAVAKPLVILPFHAQIGLSRAYTLDLGARAAFLGSWAGDAGPVGLLRPELGFSWWPLDAFGTGPVIGASLWTQWTLASHERGSPTYGVRSDAGLNLSLGDLGSLYAGTSLSMPLFFTLFDVLRSPQGRIDVVLAWKTRLS